MEITSLQLFTLMILKLCDKNVQGDTVIKGQETLRMAQIIYVVFLSKIYNLDLIMRKKSDNPKLRGVLQSSWPVS